MIRRFHGLRGPAVLIGVTCALPAAVQANPWLPAPEALNATLSYVFQSADSFYLGSDEMSLPDDLEQTTYSLAVEYGLTDSLALTATVGYAESDYPPAGDNDGGLTDSRLGVAFRVLDEYQNPSWPTLTLSALAIIEGDYETGRIDAIGDGASGYELRAEVGREFVRGVRGWGSVGYRDRSSPVPSETTYAVGLDASLGRSWSAAVSYDLLRSDGDLDIGGPGFTDARFPEVREEYDLVRASLAYRFAQRWGLALNYASVLDGRNTSASDVYGLAIGLAVR